MKFAPVRRAISAGLDDGVVEYVRHAWIATTFAIAWAMRFSEVYAGSVDAGGSFVDEVKHSTARGDGAQTATWCSSVDPWHRESDAQCNGGRHTGFDLFFTSGITNNLPAMIPVTLLYGTPDDAAAEIALSQEARLPDRLGRDGRGAGRPAHAPRRLRRFLRPVGPRDAPGRPDPEARRAGIRGNQRGAPRVARREGPNVVDGTVRRLSARRTASSPTSVFIRWSIIRSAATWTGRRSIASRT